MRDKTRETTIIPGKLIIMEITNLYATSNILIQKNWGSTKIDPNILSQKHQDRGQEIILTKVTTKTDPLIITQFNQEIILPKGTRSTGPLFITQF